MRSVAAAAHEAATAPHQPGAAADSGQHDPDSGVQGGPARGARVGDVLDKELPPAPAHLTKG